MHSRLKEIVAEKHKEVDTLKKTGVSTIRITDIPPIRDFKRAISAPDKIALIAEIKFASPSAGIICEKSDPIPIGRAYEEAGAAAISLLTDKKFFSGDLDYLPPLKKAVSLPVLCKDFFIDEIQVKEASLYGADAILLIARILEKNQLKALLRTCQDFGIAALTEVHDRPDLEKAIECRAEIIGINNRNLDTFEVDLNTTIELAPLVPEGFILVGESGIRNGEDIQFLKEAGIQAALVGTGLMESEDIAKTTRELVEAGIK